MSRVCRGARDLLQVSHSSPLPLLRSDGRSASQGSSPLGHHHRPIGATGIPDWRRKLLQKREAEEAAKLVAEKEVRCRQE